MLGGLHTSMGRGSGGMGQGSVFAHRKPPTLLPVYGSWSWSMRTLGTAGLHEEATTHAKGKSKTPTWNMQN